MHRLWDNPPLGGLPVARERFSKRRSYCRPCKATYQRAWYERNRDRHIADVRRLRAAYTARNRRIVAAAKAVPCGDCGERFPSYVMDFDHVRGEKTDLVPKMAARPVPLLDLMIEIAKCDVVCANCHRLRTHRRGWPRPGSRMTRAARSPREPRMKGQFRLMV